MTLERGDLIADRTLKGSSFTEAYTAWLDEWIRSTTTDIGVPDGAALVAIGGYGRRDMAPQSDVDIALIHRSDVDVSSFADLVWYPIWDAGIKLGQKVDTVEGVLKLARTDLDTATSLLDVRHLLGDEQLSLDLAVRARKQWSDGGAENISRLRARVETMHAQHGEVAFLLGPDIKVGRGGLRDVHALHWAAAAGLLADETDVDSLAGARETLLRARVELHRLTGRAGDKLALDFQDEIAEALGYRDADELMADVAASARSIAWVSDATWFWVERRLQGSRRSTDHEQIDGDMIVDGSLLSLTSAADPSADPTTLLRVATAAARRRAFVDHETLRRLAAESSPLAEPWTPELRSLFDELLRYGHPAIPVIEAFDQVGLMSSIMPEWEPCRSRPQRNAYHRFTVDRHLLEAAAEAASRTDRVVRGDLLVLGALLHDIGKGYPGDHTDVGVELIDTIGRRMGYDDDDVRLLTEMCRHHLLLADVATRRDLDDEGTIRTVADAIGSIELLGLLGALTEADSIATGPSAWSAAKAELVHLLMNRVGDVLDGVEPSTITARFPAPEQQAMMDAGGFSVRIVDDTITVVQIDRPGAFSRVAGVLTLNGLDILAAAAHTAGGMALSEFTVRRSGELDTRRLEVQLESGTAGRLAIEARVDDRRKTYARTMKRRSAQPVVSSVSFDNTTSDNFTVVEVTGRDEVGLLYRVSHAMAELGVTISTARIQTIGDAVVDAFYVTHEGHKIDAPEHLAEIERSVLHSIRRK